MAAQIQSGLTILRRKQVEARTGVSRSTIYARIKNRTFPAPIPLGVKSVGWLESEIDAFLTGCIAERKSSKVIEGGKVQ